jgi:hypothetical protein
MQLRVVVNTVAVASASARAGPTRMSRRRLAERSNFPRKSARFVASEAVGARRNGRRWIAADDLLMLRACING